MSDPRAKGFREFLRHNLWWLVALLLALVLLPRGVVTEAELNRTKPDGKDDSKWTEYLVYKLAAARMREGTSINAIDLKGSLHPDKLGQEEFEAERARWQVEYQRLLHVEISPNTAYRLHEHAYSYPPLWALLAVPLDALGNFNIEVVIWHFLVVASLAVAARIAFLLLFEGRGQPPPEVKRGFKAWLTTPQGIGVSACVIAFGYLLGPVSNQQNDSMVFAFVMLGALALRRERSWLAGLCFGLAAFSKGPLLLLLPWLCFKRRWLSALATFAFGLGFSLLPDLFFPANSGKLYLYEWYEIGLKPLLSSGEAAASSTAWFRFNELNQSLGATLDRLFGLREAGRDVLPALVEIPDKARKYLTYGLYLILMLAALAIARVVRVSAKSIFAKPAMPFVVAPSGRGLVLELSLVMILACLLSPMTSPPHLCVLIAPLLLMLDEAWQTRARWLVGLTIFAALPMLFVHKDLAGRDFVTTLRFYGISVWVMLAMFAGLAMIAKRHRNTEANTP
ncbi:MAG: DUF2029 domain-containing protein [Planctomycetes bacterium]|nr:DUF2029 domain-containing protein [Planctomycetota bacterium]